MPPLHIRASKTTFNSILDGRSNIYLKTEKLLVGFRDTGSALARFSASLVFAADQQGGHRVLEDELFLCFGFKHDGILIE